MTMKEDINSIIKNTKGVIAVAAKNLHTGEEIKFNENLILPSASLIKLVVMADLFCRAKEGILRLDEQIVLTDSVKVGGDGILKELIEGHNFTVLELIKLMIIISDNTAANMLINIVGIDSINKTAKKLGLQYTNLQRLMMDFKAQEEGRDNLTCAEDMMRFFELMYFGKVADKESSILMIEIMKKQQIKGKIDLYLPCDTVIAHKTGDLYNLEHDAGIIFLPHCTYIICVLTTGLETKNAREAIGKISKIVYDYYG